MSYLFIGKSGVFETMVVASALLKEKTDYLDLAYFSDIQLDTERKPILIGEAPDGRGVYTLGDKEYQITAIMAEELSQLAGEKSRPLAVIPVSFPGDQGTYLMSKLAMIPLVGRFFYRACLNRVLANEDQLLAEGEAYRRHILHHHHQAAAKPLP